MYHETQTRYSRQSLSGRSVLYMRNVLCGDVPEKKTLFSQLGEQGFLLQSIFLLPHNLWLLLLLTGDDIGSLYIISISYPHKW
jgi:hypothetical protein